MAAFDIKVLATEENFEEEGYLRANPDVAAAVAAGIVADGKSHFAAFGRREARKLEQRRRVVQERRRKLERILPLLDLARPHVRREDKFDFLTDDLRKRAGLEDTNAVSALAYDPPVLALLDRHAEGLALDCGAGDRPVYYPNVVNFEAVDYTSTDVIGIAEDLPFVSEAFDAVISVAVLEHVRDPFSAAAEMARVLKPGGELICAVPFLQPEHGYPHHYFNMAPMGLRSLFEDRLQIDSHEVTEATLPIWTLTWFLKSWADGLQGPAREEFLGLRVGELMGAPTDYLARSWVRGLDTKRNMELASATVLRAHKRART